MNNITFPARLTFWILCLLLNVLGFLQRSQDDHFRKALDVTFIVLSTIFLAEAIFHH